MLNKIKSLAVIIFLFSYTATGQNCPAYSNTVTASGEACGGQNYLMTVPNTGCNGEIYFDVVGNYGTFGNEITWEIVSTQSGVTVASGGPGTNGGAINVTVGPLDPNIHGNVFDLGVYDTWGDGFSGGGYIETQQGGTVLTNISGNFGPEAHSFFNVNIVISPATITINTPSGNVVATANNCNDFILQVPLNNTNFCNSINLNLPWTITCDVSGATLASGNHSVTVYPEVPSAASDLVEITWNTVTCSWDVTAQNDCDALDIGNVFNISPDPSGLPTDACANGNQNFTIDYIGLPGSPDCCATAGPVVPITYESSQSAGQASVASSPFGGTNNSAYFYIAPNGSGGNATSLTLNISMTDYCYPNVPGGNTDTYWVTIYVDGNVVYDQQFTPPPNDFNTTIDLTDIPGGYDQNSEIEVYFYPNTFSAAGTNTTFVPGATCASLGSGEWTAAAFDISLDVTYDQTTASPVSCSFDIAEPQACCDNTNLSASNPANDTVQCSDNVPPADPAVVNDETSDCSTAPTVTFISEVSDNNVCNGEQLTRTYEVADACGNTIQVTHTIVIDSYTPTFTITGSDPTTCGGTDGFITIGGLDPNTSYEIGYDGNGTITVTTDVNGEYDITGLGAGSFTNFSVAATSCALCEFTDGTVINLVDPNGPTPTITGDTDYCQGQTAAISTGAFSSYLWSTGATTQNTNVTDADNPITVTVTDANGCSGTSAPYNVTENPSPTPTITGATSYCIGSSASISAPAGFSIYNWSNGANTQSTNVTNADNPITVSVTDANGCTGTSADFTVSEESTINYTETIEICQGQSATIHGNVETVAGLYEETFTTAGCDSIASITLVVNTLPTITASATETAICDGESTGLSVSGGDTYIWDNGLGAGQNHTVSPTTTTTYEVTGTDLNSCENTNQIEITVNSLPTVDAGSDITECEGTTITLTGSGTATSYTWDNGVTDGVGFTQPVGTVTYTVTGEDANGCTDTDQVDVTIQTEPTVNAGANIVECEGTTITLTGSGTATSYSWDNGVTDGVGFTQPVGTVTYTVTGTIGSSCSSTDQVDVTINANPIVDAGVDQSICAGDNVTLSGSGADDYSWDNGVTDGVAFTPGSTTTYTVTGEDLVTGCTATDDVTITVNSLPTVDAGVDQTICEGEEIVLSGTGADSYSWDNGVVDGTPFVPGSTTTYTVTGTDANGCENTATVTITLTSQPNADFTATINSGQAPLDVDFINNSTNGTIYDWNFGNGQSTSTGTLTDESMTYVNAGSYVVVLTVSNGTCTDQTSTIITVEDLPLIYNIPNVFTPNGDDSNDLLHMGLVNAASLEMEIFNRWGNLVGVVNSTDSADGWDGRHMNTGAPVAEGVYFYTYKIVDLNGEEIEGHQYIHLNR